MNKTAELSKKIIEILKNNPNLSNGEIAKKLDVPKNSVQNNISLLKKLGNIKVYNAYSKKIVRTIKVLNDVVNYPPKRKPRKPNNPNTKMTFKDILGIYRDHFDLQVECGDLDGAWSIYTLAKETFNFFKKIDAKTESYLNDMLKDYEDLEFKIIDEKVEKMYGKGDLICNN